LDLRDALAEALDQHPALVLLDVGDAPDLVITDHLVGAPEPMAALWLDSSATLRQAPAALILSLAHVLAAGVALPPAGGHAEGRPPETLSPREREVLDLLVDGASNKAIARALTISISTVKYHVAAVFAKLGARTRSEAVALALREGLVRL
jgi:two-component system nitrate/nitrite response regulator NarL